MRHSKDLIGKPVYAIDDGRLLGNVKDVYFDVDLDWLTGIHMGTEGLIRRKSLLIPRESVVVFGIDAILVKNAEAVSDDREVEEADKWIRLDDLRGRDVDTPGGTKVGAVGDVALDAEARIVGVTLSKVHVAGPIAEERYIARSAMLDTGSADGAMTVDLAKAEQSRNVAGTAPAETEE